MIIESKSVIVFELEVIIVVVFEILVEVIVITFEVLEIIVVVIEMLIYVVIIAFRDSMSCFLFATTIEMFVCIAGNTATTTTEVLNFFIIVSTMNTTTLPHNHS